MIGNVHLLQNGCAVVGDCDVAIGGDEDLVEAARAEGALDDVCDGTSGENVRFDSLVAVLSLLLALAVKGGLLGGSALDGKVTVEVNILPNNDEGSALLVLRHHSCMCLSVFIFLGKEALRLVVTIGEVQVW